MDRKVTGKIINMGIAVLFAGMCAYAAFYAYGRYDTPADEAREGTQIMIEGAAPAQPAQPAEEQQEASAQDYSYEGYTDIMATAARDIKLYIQGDICYLFLPSHADREKTVWKYDENKYAITCDGQPVKSGDRIPTATHDSDSMTAGQQGITFTLRDAAGDEEKEYDLRIMQSANLPAIYIDTDSGGLDYINQDKAHMETGSFLCVTQTGETDSEGALDKIAGRGYSSFKAAKKSYGITLSSPQDVMGMGSAQKWVLQANAYDLSRIRNKTAYDLARDIGMPYAVECEYADMYFNGEYAGNYLICEKIEVVPGRTQIGDDYLLEAIFSSRPDEEEDLVYIRSKAGLYEVKNPEPVTEDDLAYLQTYMDEIAQQIENCETREDYLQLSAKIDMESFARMYYLNELTNEMDLNRASTFYFISRAEGDRLYAGPVWDYDRSMGNVEGARYEHMTCFAPGLGEKLFACEYFRQDVQKGFQEQYANLTKQYLTGKIQSYYDQIRPSVLMDEIRWGSPDNNGYMNFNHSYASFDDAVTYVSYYLEQRFELIQSYLNEPERWHQIEFVNSSSTVEYDSRRYWVEDGAKVPDEVIAYLQEIFECSGWQYEDGRMCQTGRPVYQDMRLLSYAEETTDENSAADGQESGSSGYSKRFVLFCMLLAAGCGGIGGIVVGVGGMYLYRKKKGGGSDERKTVS